MPIPSGVEVANLTETVAALRQLGASLPEIREALYEAAGLVQTEAEGLAPKATGALAGSMRVSAPWAPSSQGSITELELVSDSPYAKNFHEAALRGSGASVYYWFKLTTATGVHPIIRRLPNAPFMIQAVDRKQDEAAEMVAAALDALLAEWGSD